MKVYKKISALINAIKSSKNQKYIDKWEEELEILIDDYLPSGSGFNNTPNIIMDSCSRERIFLNIPFQELHKNGYYNELINLTIIVKSDLQHDFDIVCLNNIDTGILDYILDTYQEYLNKEL